jgi:hypothetical protein
LGVAVEGGKRIEFGIFNIDLQDVTANRLALTPSLETWHFELKDLHIRMTILLHQVLDCVEWRRLFSLSVTRDAGLHEVCSVQHFWLELIAESFHREIISPDLTIGSFKHFLFCELRPRY